MLHRQDPDGLIVIGQPAHAWVSGQLARAWGNDRFGGVAPWEEVCLGAEQHDIGMAAWEAAPTLNERTGRPHSFLELPLPLHLAGWSRAARLVVPQCRYAALLVSLHGTGLYARRDTAHDAPEARQAIREYLDREAAFQAALIASLARDPRYAAHATPAAVARNRALVRVWDDLSLSILIGRFVDESGERRVRDVPTADGAIDMALRALDRTHFTLDPWPFAADCVELRCEGRRLTETFNDEAAMRAALDQAPWVPLAFELRAA